MNENKINLVGVLQEGALLGVKNAASLVAAVILWVLTIWIPYINVGTTIALNSIPIAMSKGEVISPLFIFDAKYRKYMGEYFQLQGLQSISLIPAYLFMIVPGIIIAIGWSLSLYIMLDKGVSPSEAMTRSTQCTYGYKWTIFGVIALLTIAFYILAAILGLIPYLGGILVLVLLIALISIMLACMAVIYRDLTAEVASQE